MKCSKCGSEINDAAMFCKECGARIEAAPEIEKKQDFEQETVQRESDQSFELEHMQNELHENTKTPKKENKKKFITYIVIAIVIIAGLLMGLVIFGGKGGLFQKESDIPAGSYYQVEEDIVLEVDGNNVVITDDGNGYMGTIDSNSKTINWKDEYLEPATYEIMNGRLYLTISGETISFEKMDEKELGEYTKYKYKGTGESMTLGEYEVGTDVKPGNYKLTYYAYDEDFNSSDVLIGTVKVGDNDELKFKDSDEKKVVLKDGDRLVLDSEGSESEFYLYSE